MTAPEFLLEHLSRTLWDPVNPRRLGSLDTRFRFRVNGEVYRFADSTTLRRFQRNPTRWCGVLRDPVIGLCFVPNRASPQIEWVDGPYFFTCDSTRTMFCRNPALFAVQRDY